MRVLSVQVGRPRTVSWNGKKISTSIFKSPVLGRVPSSGNNLAGDRQSDPRVHGGELKAIYVYPYEHYPYWETVLETKLDFGAFGENLTTEGLLETNVRPGDRFQIGSLELIATQPRMPCYKLGIRHNNDDMVRLFLQAERPGIYFQIVRQGDVGENDTIALLEESSEQISIVDLMRLKIQKTRQP